MRFCRICLSPKPSHLQPCPHPDSQVRTGQRRFAKRRKIIFLVSDGSRENRKKIIERMAAKDKAVGFLLSVIDFEWTLRRVILKSANAPTRFVRDELSCCHGLKAYKEAWKKLIADDGNVPVKLGLCQIINDGGQKKGSKALCQLLKEAFDARHRLVHGVSGFLKDVEAESHMLNVFAATDKLAGFAEKQGLNVFEKLRCRKAGRRAK